MNFVLIYLVPPPLISILWASNCCQSLQNLPTNCKDFPLILTAEEKVSTGRHIESLGMECWPWWDFNEHFDGMQMD